MSRIQPAVAPFETPVRGGRRARLVGLATSWPREATPFAAVTLVALALRLADLGAKPLHHDESAHAWFGWRLATGEGYAYDPVFHGPVQFYLIALADLVLGAGDYVARLPYALSGSAAVFLPFLLRRQLGTVAALTASLLLCLAPSFLYFSRFAREDIHIAALTLGLIVVVVRFFDEPRRWHPGALLGLLAVGFATKETTYITVFVGGLFLGAAVAVQALRRHRSGGRLLEADLVRRVTSLGLAPWAWGASIFLLVYTLLFSTFLTNPAGVQEGLWGSLDYWLSQQPVNRGGQRWFYYLVLIPAYEWPIVILGLAGTVSVLRRPTVTGVFLVWMFAGNLAVYSWASERMPWLVLHPLLPLVLLAGVGAQSLWSSRRHVASRLGLAVAALAAAGAAYVAVGASYLRAADARELLVQVQTSDDVPGVRDEVLRLQSAVSRARGEPLMLTVDSWEGTAWPWGWYLRDVPVGFHDMSDPASVEAGPVVVVSHPNQVDMDPLLEGYDARRFRLRVWWVPDWGGAGPGDWLRWAVRREAWSPTATMDAWLYVRRDVAQSFPAGR